MNKLLRKLFRAFSVCLIFYLLFVQLPLKGTVLCVSEDGHINLEDASPENPCKDSYNYTSSERIDEKIFTSKVQETDYCGDCKDLVITDVYEDHILSSYDLASHDSFFTLPLLIQFRNFTAIKSDILQYHTDSFIPLTPVDLSTRLLC